MYRDCEETEIYSGSNISLLIKNKKRLVRSVKEDLSVGRFKSLAEKCILTNRVVVNQCDFLS